LKKMTRFGSFNFFDCNGHKWSVPTGIGELGANILAHKSAMMVRREASQFIRVGKMYYAHVNVCGSGGFPSLISIYDPAVFFGQYDYKKR
jgi:hypothetical protein